MNISRKDFFRKSLFSLGEALCSASGVLKISSEPAMPVPDTADFVPTPRNELSAVAHNDTCLARNSGCFACMERCESGAIKLIPGVGVRINQQLCTGCGTCEYICPVTPKGVRMEARTTMKTPSADQVDLQPQKGETPC
jgi:ferredoxin